MIKIENLTKKYSKQTVLEINSLEIPSGQTFGLIGNKFMGVLIGVALMVGLINVATIVVDKISGGASPTSKK